MDDRTSSLPDEIICHIGSFLSAKEAAFAMVLSRRWRNLFTIIPELQLHRSRGFDDSRGFEDLLDGVLGLPVTTRIRKFSLKWCFMYNEPDINRCLSHVLKLGVMDLKLRVYGKKRGGYSLPLEVFTCETVANLSLAKLRLGFGFLPTDVFLPALKTLCLASVRFHDPCAFNTLLSACPVLEELIIFDFREWKCSHTVSSPTIKRLTIDHNSQCWGYEDDSEYESISFDTPALTYLDYSDCAQKVYPIVNLNSLVEAKLNIYVHEDTLSDPTNLIEGLKNVEILSLTDETIELIHGVPKTVPMFENLSHLTLVNKGECCWGGLRVLIQNSPKLKTLIIDGSLHSDKFCYFEPLCECLLGYSFLLNCPIEVLEITVFRGDTGEMWQLKQILEKLPYLALLEIHIMADDGDEEMKIMKDLSLMFPRGSSNCKIQIFCEFVEVCDEKEEEEKSCESENTK